MTQRARRSGRALQATVLLAAAALLGWQVAATTLAAALVPYDPGAALVLAPENPRALLKLAEQRVGQDPASGGSEAFPLAGRADVMEAALQMAASGITAPLLPPDITDADRATVAALAAGAWRTDPLEPRAPRLLGQLAADGASAMALMRQSVALSRHDPVGLYWLLQRAIVDGDPAATLRYADVLLRTQPDFGPLVHPLLTMLAAKPEARPLVLSALKSDPPWQLAFLEALPRLSDDPRLAFDYLRALAGRSSSTLNTAALRYLETLAGRGDYLLAHEVWRALPIDGVPPPERLLYDGTFAMPPGATPFSWRFESGGGVRISVETAEGREGENALTLEFPGQTVAPMRVSQVVVLKPGRYTVSGLARGVFIARRGLRWRLVCQNAQDRDLGQSDELFGGGEAWRPFAFSAEVPSADCPAQMLTLVFETTERSERIVRGEIAMTRLAIRPGAND